MASQRADQPWIVYLRSVFWRRQEGSPPAPAYHAYSGYGLRRFKSCVRHGRQKIPGQLLKEISLPEKIVSILAEWLVSHQVWPGGVLNVDGRSDRPQPELLTQIKFCIDMQQQTINKSKISALIFLRQ